MTNPYPSEMPMSIHTSHPNTPSVVYITWGGVTSVGISEYLQQLETVTIFHWLLLIFPLTIISILPYLIECYKIKKFYDCMLKQNEHILTYQTNEQKNNMDSLNLVLKHNYKLAQLNDKYEQIHTGIHNCNHQQQNHIKKT